MLAKARTGTGKTLAFLIPTIERLAEAKSQGEDAGTSQIRALVLCLLSLGLEPELRALVLVLSS